MLLILKQEFKYLLVFAVVFFLSTIPVLSEDNGWVLTQYSKAFGDQYLYLNSVGVKCVNPRQGIGWIARSPQWDVTFFNDKTKLYYSLSSQYWRKKMMQQGLSPTALNWSKIGSGSIAGLKAGEYKMSNNSSPKNSKWASATYWLADDIKVPSSLSHLISSICQLPESDSIPLRMSYLDKNNQTVTLLQTYRQQRSNIPAQAFYLPRDYKLAKNEVEVLLNQENRALLNELADDLNQKQTNSTGKTLGLQNTSGKTLSLDKVPDEITLRNGRTVSKGQINKFLDSLK